MTNRRLPVRVNTKISAEANDWLDAQSAETGISKSTLIAIAVDAYRKEQSVITQLLPKLLEQMERMGEEQAPSRRMGGVSASAEGGPID